MLKAGDFIKCKRSEMVQISQELDAMGIMNDFVFEPQAGIQIMGPWLDPEVELPAEDGVFHFALVNGRAKNGATCEEAPAIVEYWHDEGWFCDSMEVFDVVCWMPVPGFGKEEK